MAISKLLRKFLFPALTRNYMNRLIFLGLGSSIFFSHVLIPLRIQGQSMEPTYHDGSFAFCLKQQYFFSKIERFDVVTVRFTGKSVLLLKRVLALAGDTLEFREGTLYINGEQIDEPYVKHRSPWNLPARKVKPGYVYVVGDNRGTSMERDKFGQVRTSRIIGEVIF